MNPKSVETLLAYEWRVAKQYLGRANGDQQQAYRNLETVLSITTDPLQRSVLLNVGLWMLRNWAIKRTVGSEGGELAEGKTA